MSTLSLTAIRGSKQTGPIERIEGLQRRPRIRAMLNRSNLLIVQNLISTERNGLSCSKITLLIDQKPS